MVVPAVLLVLAAGLGALQVGGEQLRLQSAVADAARLYGRADPAAASAVSAAVPGAQVSRRPSGQLVCAEGRVQARLIGVLPVTLHATSCALADGA